MPCVQAVRNFPIDGSEPLINKCGQPDDGSKSKQGRRKEWAAMAEVPGLTLILKDLAELMLTIRVMATVATNLFFGLHRKK